MIKKYLLPFFILILCTKAVIGQTPDYSFSFDNCDVRESNNLLPNGQIIGVTSCECGLTGNSLTLNGNESVILPDTINKILEEDFTLEFYFFNYGSAIKTDIFSIKNRCGLDSLIGVQYIPNTNEVVFELAYEAPSYKTIRTPLNSNLCWHHIAITKQGLEYSFYLDGSYVGSILSDILVRFGHLADPSFSNSPCLAVNEERMIGRIDNFAIYKRALSNLEIRNVYLSPDQIMLRDTTIFKGDAISIDVGASCFDDFNWTPSISLDDPNSLNPEASPEFSTTYTLSIETNNCTAIDTVRIYVLDKDQLECEKLFLPKAFTPNNDGLNDSYGISNTFVIENLEYFDIYDRWGEKVFSTSDVNATWDGSFENSPVNPGMFLYKIKYQCQGEEFLVVDNFTVIR